MMRARKCCHDRSDPLVSSPQAIGKIMITVRAKIGVSEEQQKGLLRDGDHLTVRLGAGCGAPRRARSMTSRRTVACGQLLDDFARAFNNKCVGPSRTDRRSEAGRQCLPTFVSGQNCRINLPTSAWLVAEMREAELFELPPQGILLRVVKTGIEMYLASRPV